MIPSNTDKTPFIYRFLDALGVPHTVVPSNHTHTMSEVTDLPAIESTPMQNSTKLVTSGGIFAALAQKAAAVHSHVMSDITGLVDALAAKAAAVHSHVITDITGLADALAAKMNSMTVDSSPANNADHLVSSKGVYEALGGKMDTMTVDSTPTENSNNLVKSGGVYAAIQALFTNKIPIHQVTAILPKDIYDQSIFDAQNWLGNGKMALVLQTARSVEVEIVATGHDDSPEGTWSGDADLAFDLEQGTRTVKNIYALMEARLHEDYPGEFVGYIDGWKIRVGAKDTVGDDTACLINFYNPTSAE